jgi:hypothetical protein
MSNETCASGAALWTHGHGRSPTLQLRQTVDDKLMVATHNAFLSFRGLLHRNGDDMVLLSEEVQETKVQPVPRGAQQQRQNISRSLVVTNRHVYLMSLPGRELFAPASVGGCFRMSELTRVCSVPESSYAILQFVNGVIAIQASSTSCAQRIADILFSASGVSREEIRGDDVDAAGAGAVYYARDSTRYAVSSVTPSVISQATTTRNKPSSRQSAVGMGSEISSRGIETVLRDILKSNDEDGALQLAANVACQTDPPDVCDHGVDAQVPCEDRATSPITIFFGNQRQPEPRDRHHHETDSDRTGSTGNSDFDSAEVWKSLRRVPPTPYGSLMKSKNSIRNPSPSLRSKTSMVRKEDETQASFKRRDASPSTPRHTNTNTNTMSAKAPFAETRDRGENEEAAASSSLEPFLGVLSVYIPGLIRCGIDTTSKLLALNEADIDRVLDDAGVAKQGHRLLMHSKLSLHRGGGAKQ